MILHLHLVLVTNCTIRTNFHSAVHMSIQYILVSERGGDGGVGGRGAVYLISTAYGHILFLLVQL